LNRNEYTTEFAPYYEGFKGNISKLDQHKYLIKGVYEKVGVDKVRITELPVGTWTIPYTSFLEGLMDGGTSKKGKKISPSIRDFVSISTEVTVDFTITFPRGKLDELEQTHDAVTGINGVEKLLKLTTSISSTNMHMFDADRKLHKYNTIEEIIDDFYVVRLGVYKKRKEYLIDILEKKLVKLSNKARYIQDTLDGIIDLRRKKAHEVNDLLVGREFVTIDGDYKYLIKMPMDSVTEENVAAIMKERDNTEKDLERLRKTTLENMWLGELDVLEKEYVNYKRYRAMIQDGSAKIKIKSKKTNSKKIKSKK
jgi:DNA topoisomerase-2